MTHLLTMPISGIIKVAQLFKVIYRSYLYSIQVRETIRELNMLNNYELRDIGICRGEIYTIANSKSMSDYSDKISTKVPFTSVVPNPNMKGWV